VSRLRVYSRTKWGAKPPRAIDRVRWFGTIRPIRVHHTADSGPGPRATVAEESAYMRRIQAFHQNTRGWADIGYSYVIMPSGRVYTGRGYGIRGSHTVNHNADVGICFAGTFTEKAPTIAAQVAFWQMKRWLKRRGVRGLNAIPHRATFATACPGNELCKALGI